MTVDEILEHLESLGSEYNRAGMARYGINTEQAYGVSIKNIRPIAKQIKLDTALARELWATGRHEPRILAGLIVDPAEITHAECDDWAGQVNSWDLCDQLSKMFQKTPFRDDLISDWIADEREFVRREGFSVMVARTTHDKKAPDSAILPYLADIEAHAGDERNFVKKAVNWALRTIGKRSAELYDPALTLAEKLSTSESKSARWIGRDAARELKGPALKTL